MSLTYLPRLLSVVFACYCIVFAASTALVFIGAPKAIKHAGGLRARAAARLLFALRTLPTGLAIALSAGICLPSYLWYEPAGLQEDVSIACLVLALLGALHLSCALGAMLRSASRTRAFCRDCAQSGNAGQNVLVLDSPQPFLALAGIFRPHVVMSQGIADLLPPDELSVVLRHEEAHRSAGDNFKRLCAAMNPGFPVLERAWSRFAEYAADEQAVSGDKSRALALASALVRVARVGQLQPHSAVTAFLGDPNDLSARVERLLSPPAPGPTHVPWQAIALCVLTTALVMNPVAFRVVQTALEGLIR